MRQIGRAKVAKTLEKGRGNMQKLLEIKENSCYSSIVDKSITEAVS